MILKVKSTCTDHRQMAHTYPSFGFIAFGSYWLHLICRLQIFYKPMRNLYWFIFKGVFESSPSSPCLAFIWFLSEKLGLRRKFLENQHFWTGPYSTVKGTVQYRVLLHEIL